MATENITTDTLTIEDQTGLRFSWTVWPSSREQQSHVEVPLGCVYTPLKDISNLLVVDYEPLRSKPNGPILNPYCRVEYWDKSWLCPFTMKKISFPPHYASRISESHHPAELAASTIEYTLPAERTAQNNPQNAGYTTENIPKMASGSPTYLFVIDTCIHETELSILKDSIQQALSLMPSNSNIGLITYGAMTYVHEIGFNECAKAYVFKGTKEMSEIEIQQQLGIATKHDPRGTASKLAVRRFLLPVSECEMTIVSILEDIQRDAWPTPYDQRQKRCTGVALGAAVSLLGCCVPQQAARIMLFVGGACTCGPGKVVDVPLSDSIRHHQDIQKDNHNARFVKKALKYYTSLALRASETGHAIDICCGSLDQVGLYEMRVCCEKTGGYVIMSDSFDMNVFKETFKKFFEIDSIGNLKQGYNTRLQIFTSEEFRVCGAIGSCTSTHKKDAQVSDTIIGEGGTYEWRVAALDKQSSLAFYFEIKAPTTPATARSRDKQAFLQFQTTYLHPNGSRRLRVTTVSYQYSGISIIQDMSPGFDQECAAVLIARLAVLKTETEEPHDVLRWLDRKLIRLVSRFAEFQKNNPESFALSSEFITYPQFMYNLRRSHFLQTFNASPDEIAYYRNTLLRETVINSIVMIQPALLSYSFQHSQPQPVFLDVQALKPDVILLLDSFFHVILWHGENIHRWHQLKYHEMKEYSNFKQLLQLSIDDADLIISQRFPVPKFIQCVAGSSQSRFLLAKVNPSTTHNSLTSGTEFNPNQSIGSSIINTDDVSLGVFMEHLIKLAVQS